MSGLRYISLFSGIEAASVAWAPLGNSMCVNVISWLGRRIAAVEADRRPEAAA
jgi:site-specific DNA-cytosine methylase